MHSSKHSLGAGHDLPGGGGEELQVEVVLHGSHKQRVPLEGLHGISTLLRLLRYLCHPTLLTGHQSMHLHTHTHTHTHTHNVSQEHIDNNNNTQYAAVALRPSTTQKIVLHTKIPFAHFLEFTTVLGM